MRGKAKVTTKNGAGVCYAWNVNTASTREKTKTPLSLILEPERKIQPLS